MDGMAMEKPLDPASLSERAGAAGGVILDAAGIAFSYRSQPVLKGVDLAVREGEIIALLGANGAGKSTLLRVLLGLERPSAGLVLLHGRPVSGYSRREISRRMAYVPQTHVCPFPYSVREVVAMGRFGRTGLLGRSGVGDRAAVDLWLERLEIAHLADRPYTQISGGERQLALLARALVQGANLLVLDEPASALDFGHQTRLLAQVGALARDGFAVVMSTHHPDHALMTASRAVLLKDGTVMADGKPGDVLDARAIERLYGVSRADLAAFCRHRGIWDIGRDGAGQP